MRIGARKFDATDPQDFESPRRIHGLAGGGLNEFDLFVGKGADFRAREINYTDGLTGADQRNASHGACVATADLRQFAELGVLQSIRDM